MSSSASHPGSSDVMAYDRPSGIPAVGELRWGAHFCHFYEDDADLFDIVTPYFRAGLDNDEFCLWVSLKRFPRDRVVAELSKEIPDLHDHLSSGRIEIVPAEKWYLANGTFDPERVVRGWDEKLQQALSLGCEGMRVHANEAWLSQQNWKAFTDFEAHLDAALAGKPMLVLCTYPLSGGSGVDVFDVARTHQFSIARRHGASEIMEHAESVGATAQMHRLNWQLERLVSERTADLAAAHAALSRREALYRFLAENMNDVIGLYEPDTNAVYVSPSSERVLGHIPLNFFEPIHPDDLPAARQSWSEILEGRPQAIIVRRKHTDGTCRWIESSGKLVSHEGRARVLTVCRDVTERVRLEEQLHHAQKMEALGRLAGGVAHDFNNLLTAIFGYAELALGDLPADSPASESLAEIKVAAERARRVTRQLLTFSRRDVRRPQVVDLARIVRGLEPMLRLLLREDVELELAALVDRLPVFGDPVQLEQAIVNLVANARDAIAAGGSIRIGYDLHDVDGERSGVPSYVRPGRYARLQVSDTGEGMPAEIVAQVFEPFFTTKPVGLGTGLGLSTVFGIVKQSGGYVWLESEVGRGTRVFLLLPLAPSQAKEVEVPKAARPSHSLSGFRIAVVEDEAVVRHFVGDVLRRAGAEILTFPDPAEAIEILLDPRQQVDLLITDVVMPGMGGPALAAAARQHRPDLKVLFMSGYTPDEDDRGGIPTSAILEKPFSPADLLERVAAATDVA